MSISANRESQELLLLMDKENTKLIFVRLLLASWIVRWYQNLLGIFRIKILPFIMGIITDL